MKPDEPRLEKSRPDRPDGPGGSGRDAALGAALSGTPVPDHGPEFWNRLDERIAAVADPAVLAVRAATGAAARTDDPAVLAQRTAAGAAARTARAAPLGDAPAAGEAAGEAAGVEPVTLDERRSRRDRRRGGRSGRPLLAAAAAVAVVVGAAGAVTVVRRSDNGSQVNAAGRSPGTKPAPAPGTTVPPSATNAAPAEFSATFTGIEAWMGPPGCCRVWRLTLARDGSFRWTATDGSDDMAYDATTGRQVEIVSKGATASPAHPNAFVTTGVPTGGPDQRITKPDPLGPIADFVVALARAGDSRITTGSVAGRPTWHYDGPTVQDRLGGDGAPDHAIADVDQASGVLLGLTRFSKATGTTTTNFSAGEITASDQIDRSRYRLDPPPGAHMQTVAIGFVPRTLDQAAADVPYDLLVPSQVPPGFTPQAVSVDGDVPSSTGPEGMNPPATHVVAMTWRNGAAEFTVTLRPKGDAQWDDPLGAEGLTLDTRPVHLELDGRPPLDGQVAVDAPVRPHLWGVTGDIVVTVSGDLPASDLQAVAGSLRPHRAD